MRGVRCEGGEKPGRSGIVGAGFDRELSSPCVLFLQNPLCALKERTDGAERKGKVYASMQMVRNR